MRLHFYLSSIAVVIAFSGALSTFAAPRDADLPRLDGKNEWHTIGPSAKTTQSKCIGQATTPVCAIETFEACLLRGDPRLCEIAASPLKTYLPENWIFRQPIQFVRVDSATRLTRENIPAGELKAGVRRPGDIEIGLEHFIDFCNGIPWVPPNPFAKTCDQGKGSNTYVVRKIGIHWYVVARLL